MSNGVRSQDGMLLPRTGWMYDANIGCELLPIPIPCDRVKMKSYSLWDAISFDES